MGKVMTRDIRDIEIDKITPNLRCIYAAEFIEELAHSIRLRGQLAPIEVWFAGEYFRILDGEKRWRACKKLGMVRIRATLAQMSDTL